jgi:signal transduction histidine kinase
MTPEALEQALTPFHSTKSDASNLGLGLYLARNLSDRLGGTLDLTSSPDTGTTLTLTLPLNPTYTK